MAQPATLYHLHIALSDVDRGVYEALDLRVARHPSETLRYMLTRVLAYCLSYEQGITFSRGGLSSTDEPPLSIRDATGVLKAWIDIGSPSAERLHKAAKCAARVAVFTTDLAHLERERASRVIHRAREIEVWRVPDSVLLGLEASVSRNVAFELVHNGGELYATIADRNVHGALEISMLERDE